MSAQLIIDSFSINIIHILFHANTKFALRKEVTASSDIARVRKAVFSWRDNDQSTTAARLTR